MRIGQRSRPFACRRGRSIGQGMAETDGDAGKACIRP
jgi:hypothetical protein